MQSANASVDALSGIGLVLSGGGAKGAYQAGVWKALVEGGVAEKVAVISGTSVGAINAAAFAAVWNPNRIRDIWHNHVASIVSPHFKAFSPSKILESIAHCTNGEAFPLQGILDRDKVAGVLLKALPRIWPKGTPAVHATSLEICNQKIVVQCGAKDVQSMRFSRSGGAFGELDRNSYRKVCFRIDGEADPEKRRDMILASSAIPWCYSPVELDGRRYVDGGWDAMGGENTPVQPILKEHPDVRTIIVVRCNSRDIDSETIQLPRQSRVNMVEIRPEKPLPGIFDVGPILSNSHLAKVWGATIAFAPIFTDLYFAIGYRDGQKAVKSVFS